MGLLDGADLVASYYTLTGAHLGMPPRHTLAERAKAAGISEAVFDRGGYRYHGHVRVFAEAIRETGITV